MHVPSRHRHSAARHPELLFSWHLKRIIVNFHFIQSWLRITYYLKELDPKGTHVSVLARQKPPHPALSSGSGAQRQIGTTSSKRATHTSPVRHSLHVFSNAIIDTLSKLKRFDAVLLLWEFRITLNGISGRDCCEESFRLLLHCWHSRSSTSADETVEPIRHGGMLSNWR